jgi:hypothetical protein
MSKKIIKHFKSKTKTIEERIAEGKALRVKFPRINQGKYKPSVKRDDPVPYWRYRAKPVCKTWYLSVMRGCLLLPLLFCVVVLQ